MQDDPFRALRRLPADSSSTSAEWHTLDEFSSRTEQDRTLWTPREIAHLRFLRWLAHAGQMVEDGGPAAHGPEARPR